MTAARGDRMARPTKWRKIEHVPTVASFVPADHAGAGFGENILKLEELEAIRLKDIEGLEQEECAAKMQVSRPTFQRILLSAREKVADSLIGGKAIRIEGGNFTRNICPVKCLDCGHEWAESFEKMESGGECVCPKCSSRNVLWQPRRQRKILQGLLPPPRKQRAPVSKDYNKYQTKEVHQMNKKAADFRSCLQPRPSVLVSCRGPKGENNALAVAYCCNCSYDPPMVMVGIVPSRYSYKLIKDSGCFVANLVGKDNKALFDYLGSHSGRDGDKLAALRGQVGRSGEGERADPCGLPGEHRMHHRRLDRNRLARNVRRQGGVRPRRPGARRCGREA